MLPAPAALLAAQRQPSVVPALRVRLFDRDLGVPRLRFERRYDGSEPDGPCAAAVAGDGALLRARIDPTNGDLLVQHVAEPEVATDFSAWSTLGSVAPAPRLGLGAGGDRALLATVQADGETVEVRESTDGGASYGSATTIATASNPVTAVACAVRADGSAAVAWAEDGAVLSVRREGTGDWSAPGAWSESLDAVSALAMADLADYALLVSGEDGAGRRGAWSTMLGSGQALPPGTWLPLAPVALADAGTEVSYLATGIGHAAAPRLVLVESYGGPGAFDRAHLAHAVGGALFEDGAWCEPRPFDHDSPHGLGFAAGGGHAWLVAPHAVWHAPVATAPLDVSDDVLALRLDETREGATLRLVLRNDHGAYAPGAAPAALGPGGELSIEVGVVVEGGPLTADARGYWIESVTRSRVAGRATVEVVATGPLEALRRWRATRQWSWAAEGASVVAILRALCRQAGVLLLTAAPSHAAMTLEPAFTLRPGESAWLGARRLLARTGDVLRARGATVALTEPDPGDEPVYSFGTPGDGVSAHPVVALHVADPAPMLGRARVVGAVATAEAVDGAALEQGAPSTVVVDEALWWHADVQARADAMLRAAALERGGGTLVAPPNVVQEVGDVVEVTDETLGLDVARFRVTSLRLDYAHSGRRPRAEMRLGLGEV